MAGMIDEALIDEVAHHGVIFNRQKYYLNGSSGGSGVGGGHAKYETKDEAWQTIAHKLRTDVETCKKRWKYLRERYVSQRKQGDPPVYEHLSRPYLEKMKFLDQHIQPRKSYRNVPNFLTTSPHSANSSTYGDYNLDSKSNGSIKSMNHFAAAAAHHYQQQHDQQHGIPAMSTAAASPMDNSNGCVKIEADQVFRDFAAAVASQQLQMSQSQIHHQQVVAAAIADSSQNYQENFRDGTNVATTNGSQNNCIPSSSSMKSPLSSPVAIANGHSSNTPQQAAAHSSSHMPSQTFNNSNNEELDSSAGNNFNSKRPRLQLSSDNIHSGVSNNSNNITAATLNSNNNNHTTTSTSHFNYETDDDSDDSSHNLQSSQNVLNGQQPNNHFENTTTNVTTPSIASSVMQRTVNNQQQQSQGSMFPSNADFFFHLYQQLPHQQQTQSSSSQQPQHQQFQKFPLLDQSVQRSSEHLLGELVTTELLKMSKERRKNVQKRILEILFFDD